MGEISYKVKSYSLSRDVERKEVTGYKYVHYGDIHTGVADIINKNSKLPNIKSGKFDSLEVNDLVLADASEDYSEIAKPAIIEELPSEKVISGLHTIAIRPINSNSLYIYYLLHTEKFLHFGYRTGTGLKVFGISWNNLSKFEFGIPIIKEQIEISKLIANVDSLLTVQKRKLEALKQLKQALLQQMFPQKDEVNPRVRFANFHDAWEQRKLGEIASLRGGFAFKSENFQDQGIPIIRISNINASGIVKGPFEYYKEQKNDEMYFLPNKSILLAMSGATTGKIAVINDSEKNKYYQNQRVGYFKKNEKYSYEFILPLVKSKKFMDQLNSVLVAGAQPNISSKEINNFNFEVSTNIFEQSLIGSIFDLVSKEIGIQIKKNESTNVIKQSLLQKMFI